MGYTHGRKRSDEFIKTEALKYRSRAEFANSDRSLYRAAWLRGILDEVCVHMIPQSYSIPQSMCKHIFDILLKEVGEYNTRKVIPPFELDVFYRKYNFAVEYNGELWHSISDRTSYFNEDRHKRKLMEIEKSGIKVFQINEKCIHNPKNYENFIKNYIIGNLDWINHTCGMNLTVKHVLDIPLNVEDFYKTIDWDDVEKVLMNCESLTELITDHMKIYRLVMKYPDKRYLLMPLKEKTKQIQKEIRERKNADFCDAALLNYETYADLKKDKKVYRTCKDMGILSDLKNRYSSQL